MLQLRTLPILFLLSGPSMFAAHLPGGNITYQCLGGNEYEVTLTLFRDCAGSPLAPQDLSFASDCGTSFTLTDLPVSAGAEVSQLCPTDIPNSSCSGGSLPGIEVYQIVVTVPLSPCNSWKISWHECCRSNSLNMVGEPGTYIEARLNSLNSPCNNSPAFTQDVIPYVCVNEPVNYNLAVTEPEGHDLRYRLIAGRQFQIPVPVNYSSGNTGAEPYPGLEIDSLTGQITFIPTNIGNIYTVVRVDEYLPGGQLAGSVMRDFLFVVIDCPNTPPDPTSGVIDAATGTFVSNDDMSVSMCTIGGFCFQAMITDQDATQTILLTSNVSNVLPGATFTSTGSNPATANICWDGGDLIAGNYTFVITAEDDACPNTGLTTYAYSVTILDDTDADCLWTRIGSVQDGMTTFSSWPNPASTHLNIVRKGTTPGDLTLRDLHGRPIMQTRIAPGSSFLDITDIPASAYILHVIADGRESFERIMIMP